jgi:NADPH:quinone reductase-like Zn-dependent oxidoreductase
VRFAIDPVGGQTGTEIFNSLSADGRLLLYGTLSGEPIRIDPRLMISGRRVVEGFWLGHWMPQQSIVSALLLFREIATLIRQGVLDSDIGQTFPLDQVATACEHAETVGRQGKVLLRIS